MHSIAVFAFLSALARTEASVIARQAGSGSGPYATAYSTDTGLAGQTIFMPTNAPATAKIPVILWGVGGCSDSGTSIAPFHNEIASYGYMVIVNNGPTAKAQVTADTLTKAADWIEKAAGTGKYANVDKSRMAVSGWSCGGLQAYTVGNDKRFSTIGIFSSGEFAAADSQTVASKITKPIFYFLGGSGDVAYANGERDWTYLPKATPAWLGNDNKGHFHEYSGKNGGMIGKAAVHWAEWTLKGNTTAAKFFMDNAQATADGWSGILSQSLDKLTVTPI